MTDITVQIDEALAEDDLCELEHNRRSDEGGHQCTMKKTGLT